jgi:hypothetical protein
MQSWTFIGILMAIGLAVAVVGVLGIVGLVLFACRRGKK